MALPIDLVLVRLCESEGNAARRSSLEDDNTLFTEEFFVTAAAAGRFAFMFYGERQVNAGAVGWNCGSEGELEPRWAI